MALENYIALIDELTDYMDQDDLTGKPDTFIRLLEAKASREVISFRQEKQVTGVFAVAGTVAIPDDWVEMRQFYTDGTNAAKGLVFMPSFEVEDTNAATFNGQPRIWTIRNGVFEVFPKPDAVNVYNYTLDYRAAIPNLTAAAPVNWLLTLAPDLYLWGALVEAADYAEDDASLQKYLARYDKALRGINRVSARQKGRPTGRMRTRSSVGTENRFRSLT